MSRLLRGQRSKGQGRLSKEKSLDSHLSLQRISKITTIYQYHSFIQRILVEYLLPVRYCFRCWRYHCELTNNYPCLHRTQILVGRDNKSYFSPLLPAHLDILPSRFLFLVLSKKQPGVQHYSSLFHLLLTSGELYPVKPEGSNTPAEPFICLADPKQGKLLYVFFTFTECL